MSSKNYINLASLPKFENFMSLKLPHQFSSPYVSYLTEYTIKIITCMLHCLFNIMHIIILIDSIF